MTCWVKCTTVESVAVYVNLENVTSIHEPEPSRTVIKFIGDGSMVVKERPDDIIPRVQR